MFDLPTSGLRLRAFHLSSDTEKVLLLDNDMEVTSLMETRFPRPVGQADEYKSTEERTEMFCIIETLPSQDSGTEPEFVGITGLWKDQNPAHRHAGFGIGLMKKFWNKGYGSEVTKFVVDYAFQHLNMHRITLGALATNERAIAVYKKCGFIMEVRHRKSAWHNGEWVDMVSMGILVEDWREGQQ